MKCKSWQKTPLRPTRLPPAAPSLLNADELWRARFFSRNYGLAEHRPKQKDVTGIASAEEEASGMMFVIDDLGSGQESGPKK